MFLSKLLHFNFNCNKKPYGAISKAASEAVTFQSIMDNCEQLLPKKSKLEGILILNIKTENNQINTWNVITRTTKKENEAYYKIAQSKEDTTIEETDLPFGYQPFDAIELELDAVYKIASKDKENTNCNQYQLYFPLTPFDKEPIWVLAFEDQSTVMIGANTGEIIKPMEY